jgi:DNA-binding MarR family transcriptional regulator
MPEIYSQDDIDALSRIHHTIYYKMLHSNFEDNFPKIKGLTSLEMGVLGVLSEFPGEMLRDIAERLAVPKSTLTSVIDRLERRGYINRTISRNDRRSFELLLTEDGKCAQQQHIESEQTGYKQIVDALDTPEEIAELIRLLGKVAEHF